MGYTTYSTVSWSDGTPISSDRLQQMSTNSEAIKTTTQGYSQGILAFKEISSDVPVSPFIVDDTAEPVIALDGDNALQVGANRWIKFTFTTPGVKIDTGADEENQYHFRLVAGTAHGTGTIAEWNFGVPDSNGMGAKQIAGGSYTVVIDSGSGISSQVYTLFVKRDGGTAAYKVLASNVSKTQLFAEDCGTSSI
jgi:hypothetical protein